MDRSLITFGKFLHPRGGDLPRGAQRTPATDIVLVMMLVLLMATGLALAFTELFHGTIAVLSQTKETGVRS
jgi:hypothetical protein